MIYPCYGAVNGMMIIKKQVYFYWCGLVPLSAFIGNTVPGLVLVALGTTGSTTSTTTVLVHKTDPQILLHLEQGLYPLARFNFKYFKFVNRENKLEQGSPFGARKSIIQSYQYNITSTLVDLGLPYTLTYSQLRYVVPRIAILNASLAFNMIWQ